MIKLFYQNGDYVTRTLQKFSRYRSYEKVHIFLSDYSTWVMKFETRGSLVIQSIGGQKRPIHAGIRCRTDKSAEG